MLENDYPYEAQQNACKKLGGPYKVNRQPTELGTKCDYYYMAMHDNVIGVSVDASNWSRYSSGVFTNCLDHLNHDVILVGLIEGNWMVKNSWGTTWG